MTLKVQLIDDAKVATLTSVDRAAGLPCRELRKYNDVRHLALRAVGVVLRIYFLTSMYRGVFS